MLAFSEGNIVSRCDGEPSLKKQNYSAVALTVSLEQIQCGTPAWRRDV
jgi:hypothetical protein